MDEKYDGWIDTIIKDLCNKMNSDSFECICEYCERRAVIKYDGQLNKKDIQIVAEQYGHIIFDEWDVYSVETLTQVFIITGENHDTDCTMCSFWGL